jgi:hypothetical protein
MLEAALWYLEKQHFSVIPVRKNKKPFIKWEAYQKEMPTRQQIKDWWSKWPQANIGIVTGAVSGVDVVDCDSEAGKNALSDFLSDSFITPVSKTPKGWHYYFRYKEGLSNGVRVLTDCDIRTTGGYIVAPPSKNGSDIPYSWLDNLKISKVELADMPDMLFDTLLQGASHVKANPSLHINKEDSFRCATTPPNDSATTLQHNATMRNISFEEPGRDDALFHLANYLVKSGMPIATIEKYLSFIGVNCNPPYPEKELQIKIKSALDRSKKRRIGLTDEIRELISATKGNISATFCYNALQCATKGEKSSVRTILGRFVEEGLLEKSNKRAGDYRIIDGVCEPEDWKNAEISNVDLWLPFELNEMIDIPAGSVILIAGSQDAGKSALLMNIAKENMDKWPVNYFSSEINKAGFKSRVSLFDAPFYDDWKVNFYTRMSGFADVIKPGELNIIDYLEIHDNFFEVAKHLAGIFEKLGGKGVAVVAIQKDPRKEFARGGSFAEEKPVLSLALDFGIARINKFKGEFRDTNPKGMEYHFKLVHGSNFILVRHWHKPVKMEK